jgi:hypothetical protein
MKTPTGEKLAAELRKRAETGRFTLDKDDLLRIAAMLQKLEARCAEAYQVVGSLASDAGLFHDPAVIRVLDLLSDPQRDGDILPFRTAKDLERAGVQPPPRPKTKLSPKSGPPKKRQAFREVKAAGRRCAGPFSYIASKRCRRAGFRKGSPRIG